MRVCYAKCIKTKQKNYKPNFHLASSITQYDTQLFVYDMKNTGVQNHRIFFTTATTGAATTIAAAATTTTTTTTTGAATTATTTAAVVTTTTTTTPTLI